MMTDELPWRFTVLAVADGGDLVELGKFKTPDAAHLFCSMCEENWHRPGITFEVDDLHRVFSTEELLDGSAEEA